MPRRRSNLIRNMLLLVLLAIFLLMGVSPLVEMLLPVNTTASGWLEWIRSRVMETMVALWFFVFGSMVGSFINVVVWRMPRGVSVVSRGSACPYCTARIKLADNIPVFGWIKLRGRCRVCHLPISPRYPIVEALFGLVFLLMFFVELQSAGANLPGERRYVSSGILQVIVSTKWDMILIYAYHMILLVMLMTWSLMAFDHSRIPVKTVVFALLIGFGVPLFFPYVQPVKWAPNHAGWFAELPWLQRTVTSFLGLACGFLLGSLLQSLLGTRQANLQDVLGTTICLTTIGLFNGWQFVTLVLFAFGVLVLVRHFVTYSRWVPASGLLAIATLITLCLWKQLHTEATGWGAWLLWTLAPLAGFALSWIAVKLDQDAMPLPLDEQIIGGDQ